MQRYRALESVGEGTYGVVVKCRHKATGTMVAIKEFKEAKDTALVRAMSVRLTAANAFTSRLVTSSCCKIGPADCCT